MAKVEIRSDTGQLIGQANLFPDSFAATVRQLIGVTTMAQAGQALATIAAIEIRQQLRYQKQVQSRVTADSTVEGELATFDQGYPE